MLLVALIQLLVFITGGQSSPTNAAAFYSVGYYDCLAVEERHQLHVGSERIVLAPAQKPLHVTVDAMVPWREPSTERRPHGDCTGGYKATWRMKEARVKVTQFAHASGLPDQLPEFTGSDLSSVDHRAAADDRRNPVT